MPATLGDHRGVIKAAVTVVNRAANKGSKGWREKRKQGREGCRGWGGGLMGELSFLCLLFFFSFFLSHCDLPVRKYIQIRVDLGKRGKKHKILFGSLCSLCFSIQFFSVGPLMHERVKGPELCKIPFTNVS